MPAGMVGPSNRVLALDALRGFALLGILFGNLTWFTGWAVMGPAERSALPTAPIDRVVEWLIHCFVDGKFYGLFSLLFGAGIAILWRRHPDSKGLILRRMIALFVIGFAHGVFVWFGDIVSLYAGFGLVMFFFLRVSPRRLLGWAVGLLLVPIPLAVAWRVLLPNGIDGYGPGALLPRFGDGTYAEVFVANWAFLKERWFLSWYTGRPYKLIGLFLLGYWAVVRGVALAPEAHRALLRRLATLGLALGLPLNVLLAILLMHGEWVPVWDIVHALVDALAVPVLAVGYAATFLLVVLRPAGRRALSWLAAPGRMTLTNYILQSVIGVLLFYGYGLGLWGRFGAVWIPPLALAIVLAQALFSALWLRRFRQGPVEWLWRRVTYGRTDRAPG